MEFFLINPEYSRTFDRDKRQWANYLEETGSFLPEEGIVKLLSPHTKILFFDQGHKKLVSAGYDIQTGQIVPLKPDVMLFDDLNPVSQLDFHYYSANGTAGKGRIGTAAFLDSLPKILTAPVVEIGQVSGDTYARRYPYRLYELKTK